MNTAGPDRHVVSAGGFDSPQFRHPSVAARQSYSNTEATPLTPEIGFGCAPQFSRAAERSILACVFVASVLFAASVNVLATSFLSAPAALNMSPAYRFLPDGEVQPGFVCNLVALECVEMSSPLRVSRLLEKYTPRTKPALRVASEAEKISDRAANIARADETATQFTEAQMLAMMQMSGEYKHQAIWHALRRNYEVPPFTLSTFAELRDRGLAYKAEGHRFHCLAATAYDTARDVADYLQRTHDIHQSFMGTRTGPQATMHCTCGWGCGLRAGDRMAEKAQAAMSRHLTTIKGMRDLSTALAPRNAGAG